MNLFSFPNLSPRALFKQTGAWLKNRRQQKQLFLAEPYVAVPTVIAICAPENGSGLSFRFLGHVLKDQGVMARRLENATLEKYAVKTIEQTILASGRSAEVLDFNLTFLRSVGEHLPDGEGTIIKIAKNPYPWDDSYRSHAWDLPVGGKDACDLLAPMPIEEARKYVDRARALLYPTNKAATPS